LADCLDCDGVGFVGESPPPKVAEAEPKVRPDCIQYNNYRSFDHLRIEPEPRKWKVVMDSRTSKNCPSRRFDMPRYPEPEIELEPKSANGRYPCHAERANEAEVRREAAYRWVRSPWENFAPDEIIADIADIAGVISALEEATGGVKKAGEVRLSAYTYNLIASTQRSPMSDATILEYLTGMYPGVTFVPDEPPKLKWVEPPKLKWVEPPECGTKEWGEMLKAGAERMRELSNEPEPPKRLTLSPEHYETLKDEWVESFTDRCADSMGIPRRYLRPPEPQSLRDELAKQLSEASGDSVEVKPGPGACDITIEQVSNHPGERLPISDEVLDSYRVALKRMSIGAEEGDSIAREMDILFTEPLPTFVLGPMPMSYGVANAGWNDQVRLLRCRKNAPCLVSRIGAPREWEGTQGMWNMTAALTTLYARRLPLEYRMQANGFLGLVCVTRAPGRDGSELQLYSPVDPEGRGHWAPAANLPDDRQDAVACVRCKRSFVPVSKEQICPDCVKRGVVRRDG
jgi:hypothetical protein